jgi:tetratricopeptide (TPR) repeat protein
MKTNQSRLFVSKPRSFTILASILLLPTVGLTAPPQVSSGSPQPTSVTRILSESQRKEVEAVVEKAIKQEREALHDRVQAEVDNNFQWAITLLNVLLALIAVSPVIATVFLWNLRRGIIHAVANQVQSDLDKKLKAQKDEFQERIEKMKNESLRQANQSLEALNKRGAIFKELDGIVPSSIQGSLPLEKEREVKQLSGELESLIANYPELPLTTEEYIKRGDAFYFDSNYDSAIKSYEKALKDNPDNYEVLHKQGTAMLKLKRYRDAILAYEKALAIKYHTQAIEINPNDNFFWISRGNAWMHLNRYENALQDYMKALHILPNYDGWCGQGHALTGLKRYQEAILSYDKALNIEPNAAWGWHSRGDALRKAHQFELAIVSYDQALKLANEAKSWYKRGKACSQCHRYQEAVDNYNQALRLNDQEDRHGILSNRGYALSQLERTAEAQADFGQVIESCDWALRDNPNDGKAWYEKARCYMLQNKIELAKQCLERAIQIKPECRRWAETDLEFERLHHLLEEFSMVVA